MSTNFYESITIAVISAVLGMLIPAATALIKRLLFRSSDLKIDVEVNNFALPRKDYFEGLFSEREIASEETRELLNSLNTCRTFVKLRIKNTSSSTLKGIKAVFSDAFPLIVMDASDRVAINRRTEKFSYELGDLAPREETQIRIWRGSILDLNPKRSAPQYFSILYDGPGRIKYKVRTALKSYSHLELINKISMAIPILLSVYWMYLIFRHA